jgi:hypothetical protein
MGREIVYCEGCGNSLREDDFSRGRARTIDNRPYCTECRPYAEGEAEPPPRRPSSGRISAQPPPPPRKSATGSIPIVAAPRRSGAPASSANPLPIIAGMGGVVFILLIFAVTQGGKRRPPPAESPAAPPIEIPAYRPPADPPPPRDPRPRDPPPPPPRRDPAQPGPASKPSDPLVAPSAAEKFEAFLVQIRQRIQEDERKERTEEILRMFAVAARSAGPRIAEVEKLKADYIETLDEPARLAAHWADWKVTTATQPGMSGLLPTYADRKSVYMTHPLDKGVPATLEREVDIPTGKKTTLSFWVSCHQQGDFELRVFADGKQLVKEIIGPKGSGWKEKSVDLTPFAGRRIGLRLENFPNDWAWEHAYWSDLKVISE